MRTLALPITISHVASPSESGVDFCAGAVFVRCLNFHKIILILSSAHLNS